MSAKPVQYHEGSAADVKNAVAWYQKPSRAAALDFVEELRRATSAICEAPERWPLRKNNTRQFLLWRFPFVVIYSVKDSDITMWAVAHGGRRPECWSRRLD
jgi:toxin ParE1/3/4